MTAAQPSILLVEDDPDDILLVRRAFQRTTQDVRLLEVEDGIQAMAYLAGQGDFADRARYPLPSLILLDLYLPRLSGFEVLEWLRRQPALRHLPVVVLTSSHLPNDIQRAFGLGANSYLVKPVLTEALEEMFSTFALGVTMAPRILLVEDDPNDQVLMCRELRNAFPGIEITVAAAPPEIAAAIEAGRFDLVITDFAVGQVSGLGVLHAVKARRPDCPVVMFTGTAGEEIAVEAMKVGLDDYIVKGPQHFGRLAGAVRLTLGQARQRQAAREAQACYQTLFDGVPVGLFRTTEGGRFMDANPALVQTLGYPSREALLAVNAGDLYVDPAERARWQAQIAEDGVLRDFEVQFRCCDGRIVWLRSTARAVRDGAGRLLYYDGFLEDITERKRAQELLEEYAANLEAKVAGRTRELAAANDQLAAASRHKSEFLANMSHELRTPLNSVLGFSDLLLEQQIGPLNERQARYLTHVRNGGKHLLQLINDILDISKVEAGKINLRLDSLSVTQTLEDILVIGRGLANKKSQTVEAAIEPDLPPLRADPVRFKQVLFNLLSNAVKFTPPQGLITVRAYQEAGGRRQKAEGSGPGGLPSAFCLLPSLVIEVRDTGAGIRAEDLPRLFREFVQLETTQAQRHEGTGLGLALTKKLVELHGGRIWAESEGEGRGSTFTVVLPLGEGKT